MIINSSPETILWRPEKRPKLLRLELNFASKSYQVTILEPDHALHRYK